MSTPISAIPEEVDVEGIDDMDEDLFPTKSIPAPVEKVTPTSSRGGKGGAGGYLARYKDYIVLLLASVIALKIPLDSIRQQAPAQLFAFGNVPVRAILIVLSYIVASQLVKSLLQ